MEAATSYPAGAPPTPDYENVPRGNTQKHVNREVLRYLLERSGLSSQSRVLDLSCGDGELLTLLRRYWPQATLVGSDIRSTAPAVPGLYYQQADLSQPFEIAPGAGAFDLVTSVSGVMMFGNTRTFIASSARHVRPGGQLLVTNDNILTMRDRVSYLFTGRVRRFKLLFEADEKITQLVQHQELKRLLEIHGLEVKEVFYTSFYTEDLLYLPLALLIYPFQWLSTRRLKNSTPQALRQQLFGFKSLLCRHYVMIAHKPAA
ncbi:hypothetical protein GCM10023185_14260 [Hymenobacter saemangeumensis]|uniref:Class I SAM-dependent methyltransferase n=1 Tax=Hymenobacter saemangeumensis TaxID=1084522 RepID=A0ABP8I8C6_9BACT